MDIPEFVTNMNQRMMQLQSKIQSNLGKANSTPDWIIWGKEFFNEAFSQIWDCEKQCPFCGEFCRHEENHVGKEHTCIQHRPEGFYRSHYKKTLPKALRTQALTALTSNSGLVGLVQYAWQARFDLV